MKTPNVIVPIGFDVEADLTKQGEHVCCCSCPVCGTNYVLSGQVIRCECGFEFPTNAWTNFSKGFNDGRAVESGVMFTAAMRFQMACPYYRTGFESSSDRKFLGGALGEFEKIDWRSIVEVPAFINFQAMELCERCGSKNDGRATGLCITCSATTTCKHRTSMSEKTCEAGVELSQFRGDAPCYFCNTRGKRADCSKFEPVGIQAVLDRNKSIEQSMLKFIVVSPIVIALREEHKGEYWSGVVDCPVCNGKLHLEHIGYNGHVHGKCETEGCLNWAE